MNPLSRSPLARAILVSLGHVFLLGGSAALAQPPAPRSTSLVRERLSIDAGWAFFKCASADQADELIYDVRPEVVDSEDARPADAEPTEAVAVGTSRPVLATWVLPTGNPFIEDPARRHTRPAGEPVGNLALLQPDWDYLGEPTPYYLARSSYFGIIDLAGFAKDRFYLYQSHWRPDLPMAHILPHWKWPERSGEITPVHVFTSGDEAELFLNGRSLGRKKKAEREYRLRWDDVVYEPGELRVVAYDDGEAWAEDIVETAGEPAALAVAADPGTIRADGEDLAFVTVRVTERDGLTAPRAGNRVRFTIEGPGEIVATANGDPTGSHGLRLARARRLQRAVPGDRPRYPRRARGRSRSLPGRSASRPGR